MLDIKMDVNAITDKVMEGLSAVADKIGTSADKLLEYGVAYERAVGIAYLAGAGLTAVISVILAVISFRSYLKHDKEKVRCEKEHKYYDDGYMVGAIIIGMVSVGSIATAIMLSFQGLTRLLAPQAMLMLDAVERAQVMMR